MCRNTPSFRWWRSQTENDEEQEWNPRVWQDYLDYFMGQ